MANYITNKTTTRLALSLVLLFLFSCNDEEEAFNPQLVTVQVSADFINANSNLYLLASKSNGDIIDYVKLENDKTFELNTDAYLDQTFTLSFVEKQRFLPSQKTELSGNSFHGIQRGTRLFLKRSILDNRNAGFFNFTLQNIETVNNVSYAISSNGEFLSYDAIANEGFNHTINSKNPTRLFITRYNATEEPISYLFPPTQHTVSNQYTIDIGGDYTPFQNENISFSDNVFAGVKVYGRTRLDNFIEQYQVSTSSVYYGNTLNVYYPGNVFAAYASRSWMNKNNFYFENFNKEKRSDFDFLRTEIELSNDSQQFIYSVTGDALVLRFDFNMNGNEFEAYDWNAYANAGVSKQLTLPRLPLEIMSEFTLYNYDHWSSELLVELMQVEGIYSVNEYLISEAEGKWLGTQNTKYVYAYLGSGSVFQERLSLFSEDISSSAKSFNCKNWFKSAFIYD
jgi:hypothetical protein